MNQKPNPASKAASKAVVDYVKRKRLRLLPFDSLLNGLERAIWRLSEVHPQYHIEYADNDWFVIDARHTVDYQQAARLAVDCGWSTYIHCLNQVGNIDDAYIDRFNQIDGHVCCSNLDDSRLFTRTGLAVIIQGAPEYSWPFDCWSTVMSNGERVHDVGVVRDNLGNYDRHEHWLRPVNCKVVAVVNFDARRTVRLDRYSTFNISHRALKHMVS